jgi:galacturonosyltransferase
MNKDRKKMKYKLLPGSGVNLEKNHFSEMKNFKPVKFLTISRVKDDKGFMILLTTIKRIKQMNLNCEFHIIGDIEETKYISILKEFVDKNLLKYHGNKKQLEVIEFIQSSTCLIHPSFHEGMSNAILETAASGRPIIASDIAGCREIVIENKTGFLFEVGNSDSLTNCIVNFMILSDVMIEELGKNARKHVEDNFNREYIIEQYLKEIKEVERNGFV